jgi:aspartyl-tRNA(Asn)/glutamyl-tRNA(Gln) amidotransferase subunit B
LESGEELVQETRGYDEVKQLTYSQRSKADAHDYRYFPEADLPPIRLDSEDIEAVKSSLPELPDQKRERFESEYGVSGGFATILASDKARADYFEEAVKFGDKSDLSAKTIADLMVNRKLDSQFPEPAGLVRKIIELTSIEHSSNDEVVNAVKSVLMEEPKAIADYNNGNGNVIGFLIGMVQKKLKGKGNPQSVRQTLLDEIQK